MDKLNKRLAAWLVVIALLVMVSPSSASLHAQEGMFISDGCRFADKVGKLAAGSAFFFGLMPGLQAVGVAYGVVAIGLEMYRFARC